MPEAHDHDFAETQVFDPETAMPEAHDHDFAETQVFDPETAELVATYGTCRECGEEDPANPAPKGDK